MAQQVVPLSAPWSELVVNEDDDEGSEQGEHENSDTETVDEQAVADSDHKRAAASTSNARPIKVDEDDDVVLDEALALAEDERTSLQCGDPQARAVAATALGRLVHQKQMACFRGHLLEVSTTVRGLCCDGPYGRRPGEELLALACCEECEFRLCLSCVAKFRAGSRTTALEEEGMVLGDVADEATVARASS